MGYFAEKLARQLKECEERRVDAVAFRAHVEEYLRARHLDWTLLEDAFDCNEGYLLKNLVPPCDNGLEIFFLFFSRELEIHIGAANFTEQINLTTPSGRDLIGDYLDVITQGKVWRDDWPTHQTIGIDLSDGKKRVFRSLWGTSVTEFIMKLFGKRPVRVYPFLPWPTVNVDV